MKNSSLLAALAVTLALGLTGPLTVLAAGPAAVNLGSAGNFTILSKSGISTTGVTLVTGDIGVSPAAATLITGFALTLPASNAFSTSAQITGKAYAPGYANPTPTNLTTAILDMQTAYTDAMGRAPSVTELGAGNIGGLTLAPGVYKWGTGLTIPTDVTLSGSANDVWIFQVAQNLNLSSATKIILSGGAQAGNIFWVVAGQTTIGTTAVFNGNILDQTAIVLNTGAQLNGRALAQTAVTLDSNSVTVPVGSSPTTPAIPATPAVPTINPAIPAIPAVPANPTAPVACTQEAMQCSDGSYVGRISPSCEFANCPEINSTPPTVWGVEDTPSPDMLPASDFGQEVKSITVNLGKGHRNDNVTTLQQFLITQNKGPAAQHLAKVGATSYFGVLTRAALAEFQKQAGIVPAWGNFGPITRAYLEANF